jgi:poly(3-hydroxybutyrate) depolymerase
MSGAISIKRRLRHALSAMVLLTVMGPVSNAQAASSLGSYNVNIEDTSISGLSSGGFFAMQMGVAYSSVFKGVGIFAGGTFDCAGEMNYTSCMYNATPSITQSIANMKSWSGNKIDDVANIARQRIYIFSGTSDTTVGPNVTGQVYKLYVTTGNFTSSSNVKYDHTNGAAHTFPTDFSGSGDNSCSVSTSPYISNCNFDGAGTALQWIYGPLTARNNGTLGGSLDQFDQTPFVASGNGMDTTGWIYVPANCASGRQCKLHVALHGCQQGYATIGAKFLNDTGYNKWADNNSIIVLYPQAVADNTSHSTAASGSLPNPNGCWDWIGWYGGDFDVKTGVQMKAVMAMVTRITSGFQGGGGGAGAPAAPTDLAVAGTTTSSITLAWSASSGAASYYVYRDGGKVGSTTSTSYLDSGLSAGTSYTYAVTAVNASGESARSNSVSASTQSSVPYSQSVTATMVQHYVAGRITLMQYLQLGQEYGYSAVLTLYLCGSTWTDSSTCGPMH